MFFALAPKSPAFLSDLNRELIETFQAIQTEVEAVIAELRGYRNTEVDYYRIRGSQPRRSAKKAARFIYLNQTSFNGIYRVNKKGKYNVPYGHRTKPFLDADALRSASRALKRANLRAEDFRSVLDRVEEGDLVFLDPPYTVAHNNNGFVKYNSRLFSWHDQKRLSTVIEGIRSAGASYILTNAAHETIRELFDTGDSVIEFERKSRVGGRDAYRGVTTEYVFTNLRTDG